MANEGRLMADSHDKAQVRTSRRRRVPLGPTAKRRLVTRGGDATKRSGLEEKGASRLGKGTFLRRTDGEDFQRSSSNEKVAREMSVEILAGGN